MQMQSGGFRSSFSVVVSVTSRTEHGHFQTEDIPPELVSKLLVGAVVALVAGGRWNKSLAG